MIYALNIMMEGEVNSEVEGLSQGVGVGTWKLQIEVKRLHPVTTLSHFQLCYDNEHTAQFFCSDSLVKLQFSKALSALFILGVAEGGTAWQSFYCPRDGKESAS